MSLRLLVLLLSLGLIAVTPACQVSLTPSGSDDDDDDSAADNGSDDDDASNDDDDDATADDDDTGTDDDDFFGPSGPSAVCGGDSTSAPGQTESFDGTASFDDGGLALTYAWTLAAPAGSAATLSDPSSPTPSIVLDEFGDYTGTLVVTNTEDESSQCTQTILSSAPAAIQIEMSWTIAGDDMDLHVLRPESLWTAGGPRSDDDCYFSNCQPHSTGLDWGVVGVTEDNPVLQNDDVSGTGPEITQIVDPAEAPHDGWYQIFVHDYGSSGPTDPNEVTVDILINEVVADSFTFDMIGEGTEHYVAKVEWPGGDIVPCNGVAPGDDDDSAGDDDDSGTSWDPCP